jgi:hypothetical protein
MGRMRVSNRIVRYGYGNVLYRVVGVALNDNVACRGGVLHRVEAIAVASGEPAYWYVPTAKLSRYV